MSQTRCELSGHIKTDKLDFSGSRQKNISGFYVTMHGGPVMEIVETEKQFPTNNGNMGFGKGVSFEGIKTIATVKELPDNPQNGVNNERSVVACHIFRTAPGEVGNFLLNFGDVTVVGVLEI